MALFLFSYFNFLDNLLELFFRFCPTPPPYQFPNYFSIHFFLFIPIFSFFFFCLFKHILFLIWPSRYCCTLSFHWEEHCIRNQKAYSLQLLFLIHVLICPSHCRNAICSPREDALRDTKSNVDQIKAAQPALPLLMPKIFVLFFFSTIDSGQQPVCIDNFRLNYRKACVKLTKITIKKDHVKGCVALVCCF